MSSTVARNRIEKVLPRIVGGKRYTLENHFSGEAVNADQVRDFIRAWCDRKAGKMTLNGNTGCYALHPNHWVEFEVAA
jgi:hypothetical protein